MSKVRAIVVCLTAAAFGGCASNDSQVREKGALDLGCDASNVSVALIERPYVGVTRYEAVGCGNARAYECNARVYSMGLPIGERSCKRTGGHRGATVGAEGAVAF